MRRFEMTTLVFAEALCKQTTNPLPAGTQVEVLDDDTNTQFVVTSYPTENMAWLLDGRVMALDWMVFWDLARKLRPEEISE